MELHNNRHTVIHTRARRTRGHRCRLTSSSTARGRDWSAKSH